MGFRRASILFRRRAASPPPGADDSAILLSDLLQTPAADVRVRPVALRSLADQRRDVLAPYPLLTWIDHALRRSERSLMIMVAVVFGWWLIDGYGRDWWHARYNAQPAVAALPAVPTPAAAPAAITANLGASLPVVDDRWSRPAVTLDYIAPARSYVPPQQPTPAPAVAAPAIDLRPTHLSIPKIGLDSSVVEVFVQGGAWQVADYAVGYHHATGIVGRSNVVMAGHKGTRGAVFRRLEELTSGDQIVVEAAGQRYEYRVRSTGNVWPQQIDVMFPTEQPQLTLLTCTNWDTQRFVVFADYLGPMPAPAVAGGT
jgi:sortase A